MEKLNDLIFTFLANNLVTFLAILGVIYLVSKFPWVKEKLGIGGRDESLTRRKNDIMMREILNRALDIQETASNNNAKAISDISQVMRQQDKTMSEGFRDVHRRLDDIKRDQRHQ